MSSKKNYGIIMTVLTSAALLFALFGSFKAPTGRAELTAADFSGLSYTDPEGDDYMFRWEGKVDGLTTEYDKSWGKQDKDPSIDIVSLETTLSAGNVTITLEFAGDIELGDGMDYLIFFVDSGHDVSGGSGFLSNPQNERRYFISYEFSDGQNTNFYFGYRSADDDDSLTYGNFWGDLTGNVSGSTMTFKVPAEDLEDAGADPGSGFGVYAFANRYETGFEDGTDYYEIGWDSAGLGAVSAPAEFDSTESEEFMLMLMIIIIIIIAVVVIGVAVGLAVRSKRKKKAKAAEAPPPEPTQK